MQRDYKDKKKKKGYKTAMGKEVRAMGETGKNLQENGQVSERLQDDVQGEQMNECSKGGDGTQGEQELPTRWYCDTDCRASNRACRGERGKDPTAKNLCPYFEDMLF